MKLTRSIVPIIFFAVVIAMGLGSCKNDPDDMVLSHGKMEDVLFDYHIADGIVKSQSLDSATAEKYVAAVFRKHDITEAQFDSSLVYYMRHSEELNEIYNNLADRIDNEARKQGVDAGGIGITSDDLTGDTANIWNLDKSRIFCAQVPYNIMKFDFKADSTFKAGDRFTLCFNSNFLYQDGARNGYAVLCMILANDSVVTRTMSLTSTMPYSVEVTDNGRLGVKEIKGFFMQRPGNSQSERNSSTMRMMSISNIRLIRMHIKEVPVDTEKNRQDSLANINRNINNNNNENPDNIPQGVPDRPLPNNVAQPVRSMHQSDSR